MQRIDLNNLEPDETVRTDKYRIHIGRIQNKCRIHKREKRINGKRACTEYFSYAMEKLQNCYVGQRLGENSFP